MASFEKAIRCKKYLNKKAKRIVVLLPHWKQLEAESTILRKRLEDKYEVWDYNVPNDILALDPVRTREHFLLLKNRVLDDLKTEKRKVLLIAASISTIVGYMLVPSPQINDAIFILPGHCPAEIVWGAPVTKKFRNTWEKKGMTLGTLKELWKKILPVNNIKNFHGEKIALHISEGDMKLPFYNGKALISWFKKSGAEVTVTTYPFGHRGTIARTYLYPDFVE